MLTVNLTTVLCSIDNEDFSLYNIINQWIINKQLVQQSVNGSLIQFHNDLNNIEDILPPEFKKHKGQTANKRFKSSIKGNKCNTALLDKTNIMGASLQDTYEDQESKY